MKWEIHNIYGWIHVISSCIAVLTSVFVLWNKKGSKLHVRIGYVYFVSILTLNISSFGVMLQNDGKPGIFHVGAIVSLFFTFLGIIPAYRRNTKDWMLRHYKGMVGSVTGLYAAFFVEIGFRSFNSDSAIISFTIGMSVFVAIVSTYFSIKYANKHFHKKEK